MVYDQAGRLLPAITFLSPGPASHLVTLCSAAPVQLAIITLTPRNCTLIIPFMVQPLDLTSAESAVPLRSHDQS